MKSKRILTSLMVLALGLIVFGVAGCKKSESVESGAHPLQYTCSMHLEVVIDAPGNCPKCGMKLVEKK